MLQEIDHPHIVKVYDTYVDEKRLYIVSEYVDGLDLIESVHKLKKFSERDAATIIYQIMKALNYCHGKSIVHRQIRPENILLEKNKKGEFIVKLIGFEHAMHYTGNPSSQGKTVSLFDNDYRDENAYSEAENLKKILDCKQDLWNCALMM